MKTPIFFILLFCFNNGYGQYSQLTLNDLVSTVKLALDDREDIFIQKGYQYVDNVDGSKIFGKCKFIYTSEGNYHQYVIISDNIVHYMTDNSQTYLSIKKLVKEKYEPDVYKNKYDTEIIRYTNTGIGISFDLQNIDGQVFYIIHVTNNL